MYDPKDPTAATPDLREKARSASDPYLPITDSSFSLEGLRIGVPQEYFPSELDPSIIHALRSILNRLKANGASLIPVNIPATQFALSTYYVIASAEASSNLARYDGVRYGTSSFPSSLPDHVCYANISIVPPQWHGLIEQDSRLLFHHVPP